VLTDETLHLSERVLDGELLRRRHQGKRAGLSLLIVW
jgi:hypothetical protein